jgi:murein L,D-transpeptidase YcbB/YkuD
MAWRLAKSLDKLRQQINEAAPRRVKISDGTIGDAAHTSRASDHNPWVKDGKTGVVTALDITHDPRNGVDGEAIAKALKASGDTRLKYIIWNRKIWNPSISSAWRKYTGVNPHDRHIHVSVVDKKDLYDHTATWKWGRSLTIADAPEVIVRPLLMKGSAEAAVQIAKKALLTELTAEAGFGPLLDGLVRGFQTREGLAVDGKIGSYTWPRLAVN